MKLIYSIFFIFIFFLCKANNAQTIAVLNIQEIIDSNKDYIKIIQEIEISQQTFLKEFESIEKDLIKNLKEIEDNKLILSNEENNIQISDYNEKLSNFKISVEEFNYHYQNQILLIREYIFKEIIILLENYAIINNLDLILDTTSYLIASNSIDITEFIKDELNNIKLKLEYTNFEKN